MSSLYFLFVVAHPQTTINSQVFAGIVSLVADGMNTTNVTALKELFDFIDQLHDDNYRPACPQCYSNVNEIPIVGAINPKDGYAIPCTAFIPNVYNVNSPILIFTHGGGFILSGILTYRGTLSTLAYKLGVRIVYIDYRLAPGAPYPIGSVDAITAVNYVINNKLTIFPGSINAKIGMMGDSAGGNYAAYISNKLTTYKLDFQILIYPTVSARATDLVGGSFDSYNGWNYVLPIVLPAVVQNYLDPAVTTYGPSVVNNSNLSPGYYVNEKTPPTLLILSQLDILNDQGHLFASKLQEKGVYYQLHELFGVTHFYFQFPFFSRKPLTRQSIL